MTPAEVGPTVLTDPTPTVPHQSLEHSPHALLGHLTSPGDGTLHHPSDATDSQTAIDEGQRDPKTSERWKTAVNQRAIRTILALVALAFTATAFPSAANAQQIGATGTGTGNAVAARATIGQPSQFVNGGNGRAYWLAVTFPNGTFFQAGYYDADRDYQDLCQTGFSTFVTGLDNNGSVFPSLYNNQNCGLTGTHIFKVGIQSQDAFQTIWRFYMDGNPIGPALSLPPSQSNFARQNVGVVTEIVSQGQPATTEGLPSVRYSPAISYLPSGGAWVEANRAVYTSQDSPCRYALRVNAANDIKTGKSDALGNPPCYTNGTVLW